MRKETERIYLACPYTSSDPRVSYQRSCVATSIAGLLMAKGFLVYSPLTMGVVISKSIDLPSDWAFWKNSCLSYLEHWATSLYVLRLHRWEESVGVAAEIEAAEKLGLPIRRLRLSRWGAYVLS